MVFTPGPSRDPDAVYCRECGGEAYHLDRPHLDPCSHTHELCSECNVENCLDCRLDAEAHMFKAAEYDPRADPFYDHTAPEWVKPETTFDPVTNSDAAFYRKKKP